MRARLKALIALRYRISTQLYLGVGGGVALTVAASVVGLLSFTTVGSAQDRVNQVNVPELEAAFGAANHSGTLVAAAPSLTTALTLEEFATVEAQINEDQRAFEEQLAVLEAGGTGEQRFERIRELADTLISNIDAIKQDKAKLFALGERSGALRSELTRLRTELDGALIPAIDDQLFYTTTGYSVLDEPQALRNVYFSELELAKYRYLAELQAEANIATQLLATAFALEDAAAVEPLRERFEGTESRINRNLGSLRGTEQYDEIAPLFSQLSELGLGDGSGFALLVEEIRLTERQQDLLALNRDIAIRLGSEIDGLVGAASASVQEATTSSSQAITTGRQLLLGISGLSVAGALLIGWLYVGRFLLRRLESLSGRMRRMAEGDIEEEVEVIGRDEVAEMAGALEIFRRHALEVQRLNLVETLAQELQGKNDELESVLGELRQAQDQIVMREKLAALGELTAGVAHEIRNPLNFVKNFSEASSELIEEMREVLEEGGEQMTQEQRGTLSDISQDLEENLQRILSHGDRANRIVHDMLQMGRDSSVSEMIDINRLLDEHARLAYHSARATDPEFQLDLVQELDPEAGSIEIVAQEVGRVFLNIVGNACDATDEKRRTAVAEGRGRDYMPTVWLRTKRGEETMEVRIRDNGMGMPPDVAEKIFNPFFTTKPTNKGTGLGLAITTDILRKHGGTIRVESQPGEYTEMIIEIPLHGIEADGQETQDGMSGALPEVHGAVAAVERARTLEPDDDEGDADDEDDEDDAAPAPPQ